MKICSACRREVPDENMFCIYCGNKMPENGMNESKQTNGINAFCGSCGKAVVAGNSFCSFCGASVAGATNNSYAQPSYAGGTCNSYTQTQAFGMPFASGVNNTFTQMPVFVTNSVEEHYTDEMDDTDEVSEEDSEVDAFFDEAVNNEMKKMRKWAFFHNHGKLPINIDPNTLQMQRVRDVMVKLRVCGFEKIDIVELKNLSFDERNREGIVERIIVENVVLTYAGQEFPYKSRIKLESNSMRMALPPVSNKKAKGEKYQRIVEQFQNAGFVCVEAEMIPDIGWTGKKKLGKVIQVTIFGESNYKIAKEYRIDARVVVKYHGPKNKNSDLEEEFRKLEDLEILDEDDIDDDDDDIDEGDDEDYDDDDEGDDEDYDDDDDDDEDDFD